VVRGLARILVGYRDDLDLASRWWHRLLKVTVILLLIAAGTLAFGVILNDSPPTIFNTRIVANLKDFTEKLPPRSTTNAIPAFLKITGQLGIVRYDNTIEPMLETELVKGECSRRVEIPTKASQLISLDPNARLEVISSSIPNEPGGDPLKSYCSIPPKYAGNVVATQIVKWRYLPSVLSTAFFQAVVLTALLMVIMLNLYYRGVVYVIFGKRRKIEEDRRVAVEGRPSPAHRS
jgi:hypothetical protein